MKILPIKTDVLTSGFDLLDTTRETLSKSATLLQEGDILVISSKILALSQGRMVDLSKIKPRKAALKLKKTHYGYGHEDPRIIELCLRESDFVIQGKMLLSVKNNILIPSAGIDLSNIPEGYAVLWPSKPWESAQSICKNLRKTFRLKKFGVIICDSRCQPLRWGTTGIALSWAGFEGIEDCRGEKDIYGKQLEVTQKAVADNLSSAALVVMGESGEKKPFALIKNAPVKFTIRSPNKQKMVIKPEDCIFSGIYNAEFLRMVKSKRKSNLK